MKFSVVIPSFNRSMQLMLTLKAFEKQTCSMDQFEIIIVNDGSTDDTIERLQQYHPPYRLTLLSLKQQSGRSVARNVGVDETKERYIIFCDPDFLVSPNFIQIHTLYHTKYRNTVVSGAPNIWQNVYTHMHADFSMDERGLMHSVLKDTGLWNDQFWEAKETLDVISLDDVQHQTDRLKQVIAPWDVDEPIKAQYAKTDVAPWLLSVTRCLSMPKRLFVRAGGFHEKFFKYGLEDWELGYRLHRRGYKFKVIKKIVGYHQEHPSSFRDADSEFENLQILYKKHGYRDPELTLFAICPPSDKIRVYKNTLRTLRKWKNSKRPSYRRSAQQVRRACARSAKLLYTNPDSPVYKHVSSTLKNGLISLDQIYSGKASPLQKHRKIKSVMDKTCRSLKRG
ncbi:Glycosyltransferase, GT2 family [Fontibacillus panacisegetis]|uniref:Glycosyltransferase, GT2 family n=1 Tax=Fontibacillus panacisegetis TaxID=670482 RepID=A0A1G7SQM3_9BACL|nr:glycosyltransferase family 2 protein [Fontibacillus panacisegetis]SDG25355.1 Glycosyltransferase, GT2 family [Fontibacillus panacisegetis]